MATQLKDRPIGARIDQELKNDIDLYLEYSNRSLGWLIRESIQHYLWAHPIPKKLPAKKGK